MGKILIIIGASLITIYVFAFVVAVLVQRFIIFPVPWDKNQDCDKKIADEVVKMGDTTLYYQDNNSDAVVVFYHGNADIVCDKVDLVDIFDEKGVSYIFVEYPGYSGNSGKASNKSLRESAKETIAFINEKGYEHVYVIGQSIGTGAASYHVSLQEPEKLLLFSPFTTLTNVVSDMFPIYPKWLIDKVLRERFDNSDALGKYMGKLLIVHGTRDTVVSEQQGQELFNSIPTKDKKYIEVPGYKHANVYESEKFKQAIKDILQ